MNHAMAIGAQHGKVRSDVVGDGDPLLQARNRLEMMRFDEARRERTSRRRTSRKGRVRISALAPLR